MPLYQQLARVLKERIETGTLGPGQAVPSETQLVAEFGVARITARAAVRSLRDQGLVYTLQGQGTFVGPQDAPRISRAQLLHRRIAAEIAERIAAGLYQPDLPIPSETQLGQEYDVAKGTVRAAVKHLRDQGWVYTVPQRGTYASQPDRWPDEDTQAK